MENGNSQSLDILKKHCIFFVPLFRNIFYRLEIHR